jgi:IS1 family transposase/transposase-like protein
MIQETITYTCSRCGSINIVRNGKNKCGNRQYHCRDCGAYRVLKPQKAYPSKIKQTILRACKERSSLRGIQRIFGVARQTVSRWIKAHVFNLPLLVDSLLPALKEDVLELDELWSFVCKKEQKRWLWIALCRRTRQIVAFFIGQRDNPSCQQLWQRIPADYATCRAVSDAWHTYPEVLPLDLHQAFGKEAGETAHVERWNNTLRQRIGRFVRKTLSFSKSDEYHYWLTLWFIIDYNLEVASLTT